GNPQQALKDKGVIDSGCSRHMTGNMSYLSDFEELNGGYVAFGGNPNGDKITGKGDGLIVCMSLGCDLGRIEKDESTLSRQEEGNTYSDSKHTIHQVDNLSLAAGASLS
nr:ribonuclease H-like domain-containing protein [Tanacetum cinerariifolium]